MATNDFTRLILEEALVPTSIGNMAEKLKLRKSSTMRLVKGLLAGNLLMFAIEIRPKIVTPDTIIETTDLGEEVLAE